MIGRTTTTWQRQLCFTLALALCLTSFPPPSSVWAAGHAPLTAIPSDPRAFNLAQVDLASLSVPERLGDVIERWQPPGRMPRAFIIHLQDVHTHPEAQQHLSQLIDDLHTRLGVQLVGVEGADGLCDTQLYADLPDPPSTERIARLFLNEGLFTGAEYYAVTHPANVTVWGIEDQGLYRQHAEAYQRGVQASAREETTLTQLRELIARLIAKSYPAALQRLLQWREKEHEGSAPNGFERYTRELIKLTMAQQISLKASPHVRALAFAQQLYDRLDMRLVEAERMRLVEALQPLLTPEEQRALAALAQERAKEPAHQRSYYEKLAKIAATHQMPLSGSSDRAATPSAWQVLLALMAKRTPPSPHPQAYLRRTQHQSDQEIRRGRQVYHALRQYLAYLRLSGTVRAPALRAELGALEESIQAALLTSDHQRTLARLSSAIAILDGLLHAKLSPDQYAEYARDHDMLRPETLWQALRQVAPEQRTVAKQAIEQLVANMPTHEQFYALALQRNEVLVRNMLERLEATKVFGGILIAGGFHTPGITEQLKAHDVAYVVITPRMSARADETRYHERLQNRMPSLDDLMRKLDQQTLAPAPITNPQNPQYHAALGAFLNLKSRILTRLTELADWVQRHPKLAFAAGVVVIETGKAILRTTGGDYPLSQFDLAALGTIPIAMATTPANTPPGSSEPPAPAITPLQPGPAPPAAAPVVELQRAMVTPWTAFPADMTFSLEIEFQPSKQVGDAGSQRSPSEKQERRQVALRRLEEAMDGTGWAFDGITTRGNLREIHPKGGYYFNTAEDWQKLKAALRVIQGALPGGIASVHMHIGRRSQTSEGALDVNEQRLARLVKMDESMWYALAGYGYTRATRLTVHPLPTQAIIDAQSIDTHSAIINVSRHYPTVEVKLLTGLLDEHGHLDADRLEENLWWVFALFQAASEAEERMPLAVMGVPVIAGERPTQKQANRFLELVFARDPVGRELARRRLEQAANTSGTLDARALARQRALVERVYRSAGLGIVYDLHRQHDGYDERIVEHLLVGETLKQLANDLVRANHSTREAALSFFPAPFHAALRAELAAAKKRLDRSMAATAEPATVQPTSTTSLSASPASATPKPLVRPSEYFKTTEQIISVELFLSARMRALEARRVANQVLARNDRTAAREVRRLTREIWRLRFQLMTITARSALRTFAQRAAIPGLVALAIFLTPGTASGLDSDVIARGTIPSVLSTIVSLLWAYPLTVVMFSVVGILAALMWWRPGRPIAVRAIAGVLLLSIATGMIPASSLFYRAYEFMQPAHRADSVGSSETVLSYLQQRFRLYSTQELIDLLVQRDALEIRLALQRTLEERADPAMAKPLAILLQRESDLDLRARIITLLAVLGDRSAAQSLELFAVEHFGEEGARPLVLRALMTAEALKMRARPADAQGITIILVKALAAYEDTAGTAWSERALNEAAEQLRAWWNDDVLQRVQELAVLSRFLNSSLAQQLADQPFPSQWERRLVLLQEGAGARGPFMRSVVKAVARVESWLKPEAKSRQNAFGLMGIKLEAMIDVLQQNRGLAQELADTYGGAFKELANDSKGSKRFWERALALQQKGKPETLNALKRGFERIAKDSELNLIIGWEYLELLIGYYQERGFDEWQATLVGLAAYNGGWGIDQYIFPGFEPGTAPKGAVPAIRTFAELQTQGHLRPETADYVPKAAAQILLEQREARSAQRRQAEQTAQAVAREARAASQERMDGTQAAQVAVHEPRSGSSLTRFLSRLMLGTLGVMFVITTSAFSASAAEGPGQIEHVLDGSRLMQLGLIGIPLTMLFLSIALRWLRGRHQRALTSTSTSPLLTWIEEANRLRRFQPWLDPGRYVAERLSINPKLLRRGLRFNTQGDPAVDQTNPPDRTTWWVRNQVVENKRTKEAVLRMARQGLRRFPQSARRHFVAEDPRRPGLWYVAHEMLHDIFMVSFSQEERLQFIALVQAATQRYPEPFRKIGYLFHLTAQTLPIDAARLQDPAYQEDVATVLLDMGEIFAQLAGHYLGLPLPGTETTYSPALIAEFMPFFERIHLRAPQSKRYPSSVMASNAFGAFVAGGMAGGLTAAALVATVAAAGSISMVPAMLLAAVVSLIGVPIAVNFISAGSWIIRAFIQDGGIRGPDGRIHLRDLLLTPIATPQGVHAAFHLLPQRLQHSIRYHETKHSTWGEIGAHAFQALQLPVITLLAIPPMGYVLIAAALTGLGLPLAIHAAHYAAYGYSVLGVVSLVTGLTLVRFHEAIMQKTEQLFSAIWPLSAPAPSAEPSRSTAEPVSLVPGTSPAGAAKGVASLGMAGRLFAALGLDDPERTPGARLSAPRDDDGLTVRTLELSPRADRTRIPRGLEFLQNELSMREGADVTRMDLLYASDGKLIAVVPAEVQAWGGYRYLDLGDYYVVPPAPSDPDAEATWAAFTVRRQAEQAALARYFQARLGDASAQVIRVNASQGPFVHAELVDSQWAWQASDFGPESAYVDYRTRRSSETRLAFFAPVYPGVYSPGTSDHWEADHQYYGHLVTTLNLQPQEDVLVVGPGVGLEAGVAASFTHNTVSVIGLSDVEVANTETTAELNGFSVRATIGDNVADKQGVPRFPGTQFDVVIWNMPRYEPTTPTATDAGASTPLYDYWDGDIGGQALKRFARSLPAVLKPGGRALIWNQRRLAVDRRLGNASKDVVEEILKSGGAYDVYSGTRPLRDVLNVQYLGFGAYLVTRPGDTAQPESATVTGREVSGGAAAPAAAERENVSETISLLQRPKPVAEPAGSPLLTPAPAVSQQGDSASASAERAAIRRLLPHGVDDPEEMAGYIAATFGQQWEEALSLLGDELLHRARRPFIANAQHAQLSIASIADCLHYVWLDGRRQIERFPEPFLRLVFQHYRRRTGLSRLTIDQLWTLYMESQGTPAGTDPLLLELSEATKRIEPWLLPAYEALANRSLAPSNRSLIRLLFRRGHGGYLRFGRDIALYDEFVTLPDTLSQALPNDWLRFTAGPIGHGTIYHDRGTFNVWLLLDRVDDTLRAAIRRLVREEFLQGNRMLLSTVKYGTAEGQTVRVEWLQSWLRQDYDSPKVLQERLRLGAIEDFTEQAFRLYAAQQGFQHVWMPAGHQRFNRSVLHPDAIARQTARLRETGYRLIFREGTWWWEYPLPSGQMRDARKGAAFISTQPESRDAAAKLSAEDHLLTAYQRSEMVGRTVLSAEAFDQMLEASAQTYQRTFGQPLDEVLGEGSRICVLGFGKHPEEILKVAHRFPKVREIEAVEMLPALAEEAEAKLRDEAFVRSFGVEPGLLEKIHVRSLPRGDPAALFTPNSVDVVIAHYSIDPAIFLNEGDAEHEFLVDREFEDAVTVHEVFERLNTTIRGLYASVREGGVVFSAAGMQEVASQLFTSVGFQGVPFDGEPHRMMYVKPQPQTAISVGRPTLATAPTKEDDGVARMGASSKRRRPPNERFQRKPENVGRITGDDRTTAARHPEGRIELGGSPATPTPDAVSSQARSTEGRLQVQERMAAYETVLSRIRRTVEALGVPQGVNEHPQSKGFLPPFLWMFPLVYRQQHAQPMTQLMSMLTEVLWAGRPSQIREPLVNDVVRMYEWPAYVRTSDVEWQETAKKRLVMFYFLVVHELAHLLSMGEHQPTEGQERFANVIGIFTLLTLHYQTPMPELLHRIQTLVTEVDGGSLAAEEAYQLDHQVTQLFADPATFPSAAVYPEVYFFLRFQHPGSTAERAAIQSLALACARLTLEERTDAAGAVSALLRAYPNLSPWERDGVREILQRGGRLMPMLQQLGASLLDAVQAEPPGVWSPSTAPTASPAPATRAVVEAYLEREGLLGYARLSAALLNPSDEDTQRVMQALVADPALRPVFLGVLPEDALGPLEGLDEEMIAELGGVEVLLRQSAFSVGSPAMADRLLASGQRILIGVTDRRDMTDHLPVSFARFAVANGRLAYVPLPDGSWLGIKGSGQFYVPDGPPFVPAGSLPGAFHQERHEGLLSLRDAEHGVAAREAFRGRGGHWVQILAYRKLSQAFDSDGRLVSLEGLQSADRRVFQPAVMFIRVASPHRLAKLPQLLATDPNLERLRRETTTALIRTRQRSPEQGLLSMPELLTHIMASLGENEAVKQNVGWFKETVHFQDFLWTGDEADVDESLPLDEYKEMVRPGRAFNPEAWTLLEEHGLDVAGIRAKLNDLIEVIWYARSSGSGNALAADPVDAVVAFFTAYFRSLDDRFLQLWTGGADGTFSQTLIGAFGLLLPALKDLIAPDERSWSTPPQPFHQVDHTPLSPVFTRIRLLALEEWVRRHAATDALQQAIGRIREQTTILKARLDEGPGDEDPVRYLEELIQQGQDILTQLDTVFDYVINRGDPLDEERIRHLLRDHDLSFVKHLQETQQQVTQGISPAERAATLHEGIELAKGSLYWFFGMLKSVEQTWGVAQARPEETSTPGRHPVIADITADNDTPWKTSPGGASMPQVDRAKSETVTDSASPPATTTAPAPAALSKPIEEGAVEDGIGSGTPATNPTERADELLEGPPTRKPKHHEPFPDLLNGRQPTAHARKPSSGGVGGSSTPSASDKKSVPVTPAESVISGPGAEPTHVPTIEELFAPTHPLRPSFRLVTSKGSVLYAPELMTSETERRARIAFLRGWLAALGVADPAFVQALMIIERAKRRVIFPEVQASWHVPAFMGRGRLMRVDPQTKTFDVDIDDPDFERIAKSPNAEQFFTCAVGHEFGHLALDNGTIRLRPGATPVEVPERVQAMLSAELVEAGRHEVLSDLLSRALGGQATYDDYLTATLKGFALIYVELTSPFARLKANAKEAENGIDGNTALNMMTYFLVLGEELGSETDQIRAARQWFRTHLEELRLVMEIPLDAWEALHAYYRELLRAHELDASVVRAPEDPSVDSRGKTGGERRRPK